MTETNTALTEALYTQLQTMNFVLLHTVDAESGSPTSSAISWIFAIDVNRLRFSLDGRSRLITNLKERPDVSVTLFGGGSVHAVYGQARIVTDHLEGVPFPLACVDLEIETVRDAMFYGARLSVLPEVEKTYDKRAADRLDNQVFEAMKKAQ
ncbi:pyridoxamine 5'-phosphate oxidase family protein [Cohnella silvisoli]|uniref:Pyridoxamine 5'-phosphate oxidase family protein n=1 Tax=Cohnella silvisoli TaxID=2873699 RepID=A0ABV1L024_9BACL|nr:pyridoxamine 5'-phosphate oxidase family protein [Cohnella silvisoli]MCD9024458.1 pyridoxamine 5'-phosphate oxidase family protein [Cohnella silvisoli]